MENSLQNQALSSSKSSTIIIKWSSFYCSKQHGSRQPAPFYSQNDCLALWHSIFWPFFSKYITVPCFISHDHCQNHSVLRWELTWWRLRPCCKARLPSFRLQEQSSIALDLSILVVWLLHAHPNSPFVSSHGQSLLAISYPALDSEEWVHLLGGKKERLNLAAYLNFRKKDNSVFLIEAVIGSKRPDLSDVFDSVRWRKDARFRKGVKQIFCFKQNLNHS